MSEIEIEDLKTEELEVGSAEVLAVNWLVVLAVD